MTDDAEVPGAIADLDARAKRLLGEGEREGAAWAFYRAATLAQAEDRPQLADTLARAARIALGPLIRPRLTGSVWFLCSELARARGDLVEAIALSVRAERAFQDGRDPRGFLAVWVARALHALRAGDGEAGLLMTRWMLGWLDQVAEPGPRIWLRLYAAEHLAATGRGEAALELLADAFALATPGTGEHLTAADRLIEQFLVLERPADAARVGVVALDSPPDGPPALRARLYARLAEALRLTATGEALADYCELTARALTEVAAGARVATAPPPQVVVSSLLL